VTASLITIDAEGNIPEAAWAELAAADAIVFGSPSYMGNVSWQFKKSKPWFSQVWRDKLFAGFTNSSTMNGDKMATLHMFMTLAMQHSGVWVGTGLMAQSPSDSSPDEGPLPGDLETGKLFGKRVAEAARNLATARSV